jgi:hypothetical protein
VEDLRYVFGLMRFYLGLVATGRSVQDIKVSQSKQLS